MKISAVLSFAAVAGLFQASDAKEAVTGRTLSAIQAESGSSLIRGSAVSTSTLANNGKTQDARVLQTKPTEDEVRSWFGLWDEALATLNSTTVANMYGKGATLLPTLKDDVRTDFAGIKDYFDLFLQNEPRGRIVEGYVEIGDDWATDIGIYEFTFGTTGDVVQGRYSYFYEPQEDGTWMILHHHSSMLPEPTLPQPITEEEVQALFGLWNDALKTKDPSQVAARYAKAGVLLPTQSDDTRTDAAGIEDYFVKFLANEPTGEILESHVAIGHDWAQDVGVYEFTFGTTGEKVRGRYSFIYIYEDGEWKISHHHSSVMPESIEGLSQSITEEEVRGLFDVWNEALQTLEPEKVAALYSEKGNLLPTLSDKQRLNREEIADYFVKFLALKPTGKIISGDVLVGHNWAQDAGIYEFTMGDGSVARGRYTFVYIFENGKWMIAQHHSSLMPESSNNAKPTDGVTEDDVRNLFWLWNDALLTKDPDTVANRYTSDAVLLPTVSDVPRDTHELIEDYFVKFLQGEPSGEIIESFVHIGHDWVSDVGIYEFTMATDGSKVRGRYSFVYAMEDGEWKIAHHHSSMMPEPMLAAAEPLEAPGVQISKMADVSSGASAIAIGNGVAAFAAVAVAIAL